MRLSREMVIGISNQENLAASAFMKEIPMESKKMRGVVSAPSRTNDAKRGVR
jgi:hypothetical protein